MARVTTTCLWHEHGEDSEHCVADLATHDAAVDPLHLLQQQVEVVDGQVDLQLRAEAEVKQFLQRVRQ